MSLALGLNLPGKSLLGVDVESLFKDSSNIIYLGTKIKSENYK